MCLNHWRCELAEINGSKEEMVLTHFIVSDDVERSRRFYTEVLGGSVVFGPEPTNVALANSFIVINAGGGPTDDKPTVILETPRDPDRVSSFLNIRVTDIHAKYEEWRARGAEFLTPPSSMRTRFVATSAIPTAISSNWDKPPTRRGTGRRFSGPTRSDEPDRPAQVQDVRAWSAKRASPQSTQTCREVRLFPAS